MSYSVASSTENYAYLFIMDYMIMSNNLPPAWKKTQKSLYNKTTWVRRLSPALYTGMLYNKSGTVHTK